ncbi:hypothetical protein E4U21_000720 [Claviceps maximensis]|nr:hypothetical protein E4U21_000720 [Claviceps maximensis]
MSSSKSAYASATAKSGTWWCVALAEAVACLTSFVKLLRTEARPDARIFEPRVDSFRVKPRSAHFDSASTL